MPDFGVFILATMLLAKADVKTRSFNGTMGRLFVVVWDYGTYGTHGTYGYGTMGRGDYFVGDYRTIRLLIWWDYTFVEQRKFLVFRMIMT